MRISGRSILKSDSARQGYFTDWATGTAAQAGTLVVAELLYNTLGVTRLGLLFLATVTITASLRGKSAAIAAAVIGVPFYKIFLDFRTGETTEPLEDLLNLSVFLIIALVAGSLAGRLRDEAIQSKKRATRVEALFQLSQSSEEVDDRFWQLVVDALGVVTEGRAIIFNDEGPLATTDRTVIEPSTHTLAAMILGGDTGCVETRVGWSGRRVLASNGASAALLWESGAGDRERDEMVSLLIALIVSSVRRFEAAREKVRAQTAEEAARLREALISSISHDFRTPLAAIIGSATSLIDYGHKFDAAVTKDLLLNIHEEGERLNQFVANLLTMTRLQSGVFEKQTAIVDTRNCIGSVVARVERHRRICFALRHHGSCEVLAEPVLLEQALYNVIDNAAKYSDPDRRLEIITTPRVDHCEILIADHGPGLESNDLTAVFSKFHLTGAGGRVTGTGLGLFIVKGFIEAMNGTVKARKRQDGEQGLEVVISLPRPCQ
jgi:two-component system sensor histidine kinase KdpD